MTKFVLKSMGCKSNQFEGNIIEEKLLDNGWIKDTDIKNSDYYILNSCTVTHKSDNEALYLLRNAKHINPNIKTVLTGCVAQINNDVKNLEYIDYVLGNDDKFEIVKHLENNQKCVVTDIMKIDTFNPQILNDTSKTRISLKIQDGCNNRCSYCTIPFARGKSRSARPDFIVNQINKYSDEGYKEVVLTGIHIGQWGFEWDKCLLDLLKEIENTKINRYRLGSLNPTEIPIEVLEFLKNSDKFCPHFHLSLQSACDKTLQKMNRFYKTEDYLQQIEYINLNFDTPFIGSDIIAGFPGETDEDFTETIENIKKSGLTKIHTFPYSIRKETEAEKLNGHLPDKIKEKRANIIKQISKDKTQEFLNKNIGKIKTILIEKKTDKYTGFLKGVTENYITVLINDKRPLFNTLQRVKISKISGDKVFGEFVE